MQVAKAKYADRHLQQLADDQTECGKIFGIICTTLCGESISRLEALSDWEEACDNNDPVEGRNIIDSNIVMGLVGLPLGEKRNIRMRQFYRHEQKPRERIDDYLLAHERIRNDHEKLEHPQLPTVEDVCLAALKGVTNSADMEWANVIRQKNHDGEDVLKTYDDLIISRRAYISVNSPAHASISYGISAYSQSTSTSEVTKEKCF